MSYPWGLTLQDKETLCMIAEDVLDELCDINFYGYDDEESRLFCDLSEEESRTAIRQAAERQTAPRSWGHCVQRGAGQGSE